MRLRKGDRKKLIAIVNMRAHESRHVMRALILLNCDEGEDGQPRTEIGLLTRILHVTDHFAQRVKLLYEQRGVGAALGLTEDRHPGYKTTAKKKQHSKKKRPDRKARGSGAPRRKRARKQAVQKESTSIWTVQGGLPGSSRRH